MKVQMVTISTVIIAMTKMTQKCRNDVDDCDGDDSITTMTATEP